MKRFLFLSPLLLIIFVGSCETIQEGLNLRKPTARLTDLKIEDVKLDSATLLLKISGETIKCLYENQKLLVVSSSRQAGISALLRQEAFCARPRSTVC